jgi:hypothetical protein
MEQAPTSTEVNSITTGKVQSQLPELATRTATAPEEEEPPLCYWCNGTGENRWGTGACRDCRGLGIQGPKRGR